MNRFGRVWRGPVCQLVPVAARPGAMPRFRDTGGNAKMDETPDRLAAEGPMLLRGVDGSRGGGKAIRAPCKINLQI